MSFVLEALKKQEAGADPDAAVSLARSAAQHRRYRLWMGLFALAMLVNAGLLLWVYAGAERGAGVADGAATGTAQSSSGAIPAERRFAAPSVSRAGTADQRQQPSSAAGFTGAPPLQDPAPIAESSPAPTRGEATAPAQTSMPGAAPVRPSARPTGPVRVALADLPPDARARFPGIAFSTHIYADDPDLRAVVANGRRLTEGERIRGLEIVQITAAGVVLAFENYRVEVPVVTDWDALD